MDTVKAQRLSRQKKADSQFARSSHTTVERCVNLAEEGVPREGFESGAISREGSLLCKVGALISGTIAPAPCSEDPACLSGPKPPDYPTGCHPPWTRHHDRRNNNSPTTPQLLVKLQTKLLFQSRLPKKHSNKTKLKSVFSFLRESYPTILI